MTSHNYVDEEFGQGLISKVIFHSTVIDTAIQCYSAGRSLCLKGSKWPYYHVWCFSGVAGNLDSAKVFDQSTSRCPPV